MRPSEIIALMNEMLEIHGDRRVVAEGHDGRWHYLSEDKLALVASED